MDYTILKDQYFKKARSDYPGVDYRYYNRIITKPEWSVAEPEEERKLTSERGYWKGSLGGKERYIFFARRKFRHRFNKFC